MFRKTLILLAVLTLPTACGVENADLDQCRDFCNRLQDCEQAPDLQACLHNCDRLEYEDMEKVLRPLYIRCMKENTCEDFVLCLTAETSGEEEAGQE